MDFSLILFMAVVGTGLVSLGYWVLVEGARRNAAPPVSGTHAKQPLLVEYARALFPVVLIVFVIRSFVVEPFRIPSGSMLPTLYVGDFILVNKFSYGLRLPIIYKKIIPFNAPQRGDVMVFRYPHNPKVNYIKRVIGLPGDTLRYQNKQLTINGKPASLIDGDGAALEQAQIGTSIQHYRETIDNSTHSILLERSPPIHDLEVTVPADKYFVMGDNRDHSNDSRYWNFVPQENIVGKAFLIWFSWSSTASTVRWDRLGSGLE